MYIKYKNWFISKLVYFSFVLFLPSCSSSVEQARSFTATATAPVLVMERIVIEEGSVVKDVFGEITVKPDGRDEYFELKKGDQLNQSDVIYMSKDAEIILVLPSDELKVIYKNEVGDAYIVTHPKTLIKT